MSTANKVLPIARRRSSPARPRRARNLCSGPPQVMEKFTATMDCVLFAAPMLLLRTEFLTKKRATRNVGCGSQHLLGLGVPTGLGKRRTGVAFCCRVRLKAGPVTCASSMSVTTIPDLWFVEVVVLVVLGALQRQLEGEAILGDLVDPNSRGNFHRARVRSTLLSSLRGRITLS